jgi:hypothetical protein
MVIHDLDILRSSGPTRPAEANSPLIVDANAVLAGSIAPQRFQAIASQRSQVIEAGRGVQDLEPFRGLARKTPKREHPIASCERSGTLVSVAKYHRYVRRTSSVNLAGYLLE